MKKLMMAAAIVCAAVVSQAAQVTWSFKNDSGTMGDYAVAENATYYFVTGASGLGAALEGILTAAKTDGAANFKNALSGYTYQTGTLTGGETDEQTLVNAGAYGAIFIFNDGVVGGKTFAYTEYDLADYLYTPPASGTSAEFYDVDWGDSEYASAWGDGTIATAESPEPGGGPEPTSGLLLLLGVAGLALKRKHA